MSELDKKTTLKSPTSLEPLVATEQKSIDDMYRYVVRFYNLGLEENAKFKEGFDIEKFNNSTLLKMVLEILITIIDSNKKSSDNKNDEALYNQNKKIVKDLTFNLFNVLQNFDYNDRELKLVLLGKIIQSLYGKQY